MKAAVTLALLLGGQIEPTDLLVGTQPGELNNPLAHNDNCKTCHWAEGNADLAYNTYRGTMMDLAGVDPIFMAALEIAYIDSEPAAELCIRCHYPRGWLEGRGNGPPEDFFGLQVGDLIGINCDYCHRMAVPDPEPGYTGTVPPSNLSGVRISNAQVFVNDAATKFGPHGSELVVGHNSAYSPLMEDSILCAQCHDVSNTFLERQGLDGEGMDMPVPIERTYTEWRNSDYSKAGPGFKSCMDCHMETYSGQMATAGNPPQREDLHRHALVGGNTAGPAMVAWLYQDGDAPEPFLDSSYFAGLQPDAERIADLAREQLAGAAELEALELVVEEDQNYLQVRVTNLAGHKLPTGYAEGRRMFLGHEVSWADGGPGLKTGTPNGFNWEFIAGQAPVKTWEILLGETPDEHSFHFVTVDKLIKDNRIPPAGFTPQPDTAPVGVDYPENADGTLVNWDDTKLPIGDDECWPAIATVRLYFQGTSGDYYRFLRDNAPQFGPPLQAAWEAVGGSVPELMEEIEVAVFPDGTIEPAGGPYECQPGPVYVPPDPDPEPNPEPGVEPDPMPDPQPGVDPQPDPEPEPRGGICACAEAPRGPALAGGLALVGLCGLAFRRRRR